MELKELIVRINLQKEQVGLILDENKIKTYPSWLVTEYIDREFDPFVKKLQTEINSLTPSKSLISEIENWIDELRQLIERDNIKPSKSTNAKEIPQYWKKLSIKLGESRILIYTKINTNEEEAVIESKASSRVPKRNEFNKSKLTQSETAMLMLYLRDQGVFLNNTSDKLLSESFASLTGFSSTQLIKDISGLAKSDKSELSDNKEHYDNLTLLLEEIIQKIKQDKNSLN